MKSVKITIEGTILMCEYASQKNYDETKDVDFVYGGSDAGVALVQGKCPEDCCADGNILACNGFCRK